MSSGGFRSIEENPELPKARSHYESLHEIAAQGSFQDLYEGFLKSPTEYERVMMGDLEKLLTPEEFAEAGPCLQEENTRKILALIHIYDREVLFPHSINVFRIGLRKFHRLFSMDDGTPFRFFDEIVSHALEEEDAFDSKKLFLEALLLHDVGKLDIPASVIDNSVTDEESLDFVAHLSVSEVERIFPEKVAEIGGDANVFEALSIPERTRRIREWLGNDRMNKRMPIRHLIHFEHWKRRKKDAESRGEDFQEDFMSGGDDKEDRKDMEHLRKNGLSENGDETLGAILSLHEARSLRILEAFGLRVPAFFAAHHHSLEASDVSFEKHALFTIIRFCDELEAMTAKRQYNPSGRSVLQALAMIADEAERSPKRFLLPVLALCFKDEMNVHDSEGPVILLNRSDAEGRTDFQTRDVSVEAPLQEEQWRQKVARFLDREEESMREAVRRYLELWRTVEDCRQEKAVL